MAEWWVMSSAPCTSRLAWKKWQSCDVIKAPSVQIWLVYFFWSAQPYSINFSWLTWSGSSFCPAERAAAGWSSSSGPSPSPTGSWGGSLATTTSASPDSGKPKVVGSAGRRSSPPSTSESWKKSCFYDIRHNDWSPKEISLKVKY